MVSIYTVVISVCMFVCLFECPVITHESLGRFASNFKWGTHGSREWLSGSTFMGENIYNRNLRPSAGKRRE